MTLHEWICEQRKSDRFFKEHEIAKKLGINDSYLSRVKNAKTRPSYMLAKRIEALTNGMVTIKEMMELVDERN